MTETSSTCPDCGTFLPADSPQQLCPSCLLKQAFASRTLDPSPQASTLPPTPEEIADKFPQFEITECLGRGGMGVVYKARQKSLNRWVAIKILAPEKIHDEKFAERFTREAQTLALLNHPNIVTVHDYGQTDGLFYIVMEFVDGVNLRDLLSDGKIESSQALTIVPPICEALQYAHDKGIVHRDIKPENLLIDRDGRVKIADFGIASLVGDTDEKSGTPPYMAPEQGNHGNVDHRADIYALGAVLYEMLTGDRPNSPLDLPSQKVQLDIRIDDIVLRALSKEPERRYRTANEFRTVIQTVAGTTPETTPPAPPSAPIPSSQSASSGKSALPLILGIVAAVILIPLALGIILFLLLFTARPSSPVQASQSGTVSIKYNHPEAKSGVYNSNYSINWGQNSTWQPQSGHPFAIEDGESISFRSRATASAPDELTVVIESSTDRVEWESKSEQVSHQSTTERLIHFDNGLEAAIQITPPSPAPTPAKASSLGPFAVALIVLLIVVGIVVAILLRSRRKRQRPSDHPPVTGPKRGMFSRFWWMFLIMIPVGPILGLAVGALVGTFQPKKYEASTTIQVTSKPESPSTNGSSKVLPGTPIAFPAIFEDITSTEALTQTSSKLKFPQHWNVAESTAIEILKKSITASNVRGTDLVQIQVKGTDPNGTVLSRLSG